MLKSHDIVVALKLAALGGEPWTYADLGVALGMSASTVHECVQRAHVAGLLNPDHRAVRPAVHEFLVHGARYAFPAKRGPVVRGMPTASAAAPMSSLLASSGQQPLVWPSADGMVRGEALEPLHSRVPKAAAADPKLYALLAVADSLRVGGPREREVASKVLRELLSG